MENICKSAIWFNEENQWKIRLNESNDFSRFRIVHNKLQPSVFWQITYKRPYSRRVCQFMAKIVSQKITEEHCSNGGNFTNDILLHSTFECSHAVQVHLTISGIPYKQTLTLLPSTHLISYSMMTSSLSCLGAKFLKIYLKQTRITVILYC